MTETNSKILDEASSVLQAKKYSSHTIRSYTDWIYRFFFYTDLEDCRQVDKKDITDFLTFIKNNKSMAESSKNTATSAICFLCKEILQISIKNSHFTISHFKRPKPVILNRNEIRQLLSSISGEKWLITCLMYGCGLSCSECLSLRVKDIDFNKKKIMVRNRSQSRATLFPKTLRLPIKNQLNKIKIYYQENILYPRYAGVFLAHHSQKNSNMTSVEYAYHYLFPSPKLRFDSKSGQFFQFPISESLIQKSIKQAVKTAGFTNNICCSTFRHSFATHLIEDGYNIHNVQKLLGHRSIQSTMIYKELANHDPLKIYSPLDKLINSSELN